MRSRLVGRPRTIKWAPATGKPVWGYVKNNPDLLILAVSKQLAGSRGKQESWFNYVTLIQPVNWREGKGGGKGGHRGCGVKTVCKNLFHKSCCSPRGRERLPWLSVYQTREENRARGNETASEYEGPFFFSAATSSLPKNSCKLSAALCACLGCGQLCSRPAYCRQGSKGAGERKGELGEEEGLRGLVVIKAAEVIVLEQTHAASEPLQWGC